MRLSSLSLAAILLLSSVVFAQHHETGTAPSAPPPSPASGTAASSAPNPTPSALTAAPAPSPAPSIATGAANTAVSHASAPTVPAPTSVPVTPGSGSTGSHATISPPTESRSVPTATSPAHEPRADPGRLIPDQKVSGETKIGSAPRIGQNSPGKEWKADPPRTDLRRRVCVTGPCPCAPGQRAGKGGCIANPPVDEPVVQPVEPCQPGEIWNGAVCMPSSPCAPGESWNGVSCVASAAECASIDGRAAILVTALRTLKAQIRDACGQNPPGQDCEDLKQRQGEALQRYQMLRTEAGPSCQATLADLASLE
jgi:hypothetical protein